MQPKFNFGDFVQDGSDVGQVLVAGDYVNAYFPNRGEPILSFRAATTSIKPIPYSKEVAELMKPHLISIAAYAGAGESGTDPEIFAFKKTGGVIPAWEYLPHQEETPYHDGAKAYYDGFQAELSLQHPHHCHESLAYVTRFGLQHIYRALQKYNPTAKLHCKDVVKLPKKALYTADDQHVMLGCAPSLNIYEIPSIHVPDPRELPFRFSGCHIHRSWSISRPPAWWPDGVVSMIDKTAGILLTALGRDLEDPIRRRYYGRPGEYRLPKAKAGQLRLEYRTPGAFVLSTPHIFSFANDVIRQAGKLGLVTDGREYELPDPKDVILNCDADAACKIIDQHKAFFRKFMDYVYTSPMKTLNIVQKGAKAAGIWEDDVAHAWHLADPTRFPNDWSYRWRQVLY